MKCNDCGSDITNDNVYDWGRRDVCMGCVDTRTELIMGKIVPVGSPEFKEIQRKMACEIGTAKRYIDSLRGGHHAEPSDG
jgi:hypothetical protein